jgi:tripartite-type tricarboxylate transporter receptor subunit TctC
MRFFMLGRLGYSVDTSSLYRSVSALARLSHSYDNLLHLPLSLRIHKMNSLHRRIFMRAAAGLTLAALAGCSQSDESNKKPLRVIVPLSVGSTGDAVSRRLVTGLGKSLGRTVYVDNLPGAGGMIGTAQMVKSPKDGNTIAIVSSNHVVNPGIYREMPFDSIKDITPIAVIGSAPQVLLVNPAVPVNNLLELIALAKSKPGTLHYGSSGNGTSLHLLGVKLTKEAGIDIGHVPYKGAAPLLSDLLGGQVQLAFESTTQAAPYVKAGKLRAIGITSKERSRLLPDVPTLAEQGLSDFDLSTWMVVIAPAGLAPEMVERLNHAVLETLGQPDVATWFNDKDWRLMTTTPAEAKIFMETEQVKFLQLVKDSGAKLQ